MTARASLPTKTRQRLDPATKAQAALDVAKRKLTALDKATDRAKTAHAELQAQRPALAAEVDYLAEHPALKAVAPPAADGSP